MKVYLMSVVLMFLSLISPGKERIHAGQERSAEQGHTMLFWNLENFFDWHDDSTSVSDREFSSFGERRWGKRKFIGKCNAIAKTILWMEDEYGSIPDIIGVAEVENKLVLRKLLSETALRKKDYGIVHYDSPDERGIDVALLFRKEVFEVMESVPEHVTGPPGRKIRTRDILMVRLRAKRNGKTLAVLVNHHPSKYGGGSSDWKREAAVGRLKALRDSLSSVGEANIIAAGDFNDTPENRVLAAVAAGPESGDTAKLINLAIPLSRKGLGTIRYNGRWELIDMFLVSQRLGESSMDIVRPPFLMARDRAHSGEKPLRIYSGPRHIGGVSDHLPILLRFRL